MSQVLRQSTQVIVVIGPFVDVGDGFTPETGVTLSGADEAEILKANTSTTTDISGATWAAVSGCDGWYALTLTTSLTDTVGALTVMVNDDSVCLPVFARFQVIEEAAYDALYAASADPKADVNVGSIDAGAITAAAIAAGAIDADAIADGAIDAVAFAANAITAAKLDPDVTTELQAGLATASAIAALENLSASAAADAVLDEVVEGSTTLRELLRGFAAALLGKASGLETTNAKYRDLADSKDRIDATVDADGNRTAVTLDLS